MKKKMSVRERKWKENYGALKAYVEVHKQFPDKKKTEHRSLLNWWKYNKKCVKNNKLTPEQVRLLQELSDMRTVKAMTFVS